MKYTKGQKAVIEFEFDAREWRDGRGYSWGELAMTGWLEDGTARLLDPPAEMPETFVDGMVVTLGKLRYQRGYKRIEWNRLDYDGHVDDYFTDDDIRAIGIVPTLPEAEVTTDEELGQMLREYVKLFPKASEWFRQEGHGISDILDKATGALK